MYNTHNILYVVYILYKKIKMEVILVDKTK